MAKQKDTRRRVRASAVVSKQGELKVGKSWFLGIGINQYVSFPVLRNAVKDVEDVLALLIDRYDIDQDCVILLKDDAATRESIIDQLDQLADQLAPEDKLLIYYSGHGHLDHRGVGYWVPFDAKKGRTAKLLRNSTIRDFIKIIEARHTLLISDACFSGSLFVRGVARSDVALDELELRRSRWALCSGRHDEEVNDGEPGRNSPFAESIINILRGNESRRMNVAKLVDRVMELTSAEAEQVPEGNPLKGVGHKGGQYVFRLKAREEEDWQACQDKGEIRDFELFMQKYPEGKYVEEAKKKVEGLREEAAWQQASNRHSLSAYQQYIWKYPKGRYQRQAREALMVVEEEQDWRRALRRNKVHTYQRYLDDYEEGKYRAEAVAKIEAILQEQQEPEFWSATKKRDRPEDYEAYLEQYPVGRFVEEAQEKLAAFARQRGKALQEQAAYHEARKKNTIEAYEAFMKAYSGNTAFREEVTAAIEELNKEGLRQKALQEKAAYEEAQKVNTIGAYKGFLEAHPDSTSAAEASANIVSLEQAALEDKRAWQQAEKAHQISAFEKYLEGYPDGDYVVQARSKLAKARKEEKADEAWKKALAQDDPDLYQQYINEHPDGEYVEKAKNRLVTLRQGEKKSGEKTRQKVNFNQRKFEQSDSISDFFEDPRDGQTYATVKLRGKMWLAENLNYDVGEGSWLYQKFTGFLGFGGKEEVNGYGRLYTWEAAQKACPPGWRVPTDEEWKALVDSFGDPGAAYEALIEGGSSGFNALLGGWRYRSGSFDYLGKYGDYWSSTAQDADYAWFYYFVGRNRRLRRYNGSRTNGRSCRCLKD